MIAELWQGFSAGTQDSIFLIALLLPVLLLGIRVLHGFQPWHLVFSLLWRYHWTNLILVCLMALSVGLGTALIAQERGLRVGMAQAADKFDLIISAPGSRVDMMLAVVYLQPLDVPLLDGTIMEELAQDPLVAMATPIAYGDSFKSHPLIGSTSGFITHLSGELAEGHFFKTTREAVVGSRVPLNMGQTFIPAHGQGPEDSDHTHHDTEIQVVGKMPMTGSPWDNAIMIPIEGVWEMHGLGLGHAPGQNDHLGPPFDPKLFPGTPAIVVQATKLWANYALASKYTRNDSMAFFPGTVLARLYSLGADIRQVMSLMASLSQLLVAAGVISGLVVLSKLFSRRFALLRAIGAPRRFIFAVMWGYTTILMAAGSLAGILIGSLATTLLSEIITRRTDILVKSWLSWPELHLVAGFFSITVFLALIPAAIAFRQPVVDNLRSQ